MGNVDSWVPRCNDWAVWRERIVWVNPLKATDGYEPIAAGMAEALDHVDEFVEGHSLASLVELAELVGQSSDARGAASTLAGR